jgi:hypothetical protein
LHSSGNKFTDAGKFDNTLVAAAHLAVGIPAFGVFEFLANIRGSVASRNGFEAFRGAVGRKE